MARLVKLPSGAVFREKLELPQNYYRPKDMFGLNVLGEAIDFADKVAKSEGVGALMNVGEQIYDKYASGDAAEALKQTELLQKAAEAKASAAKPTVPPMAAPPTSPLATAPVAQPTAQPTKTGLTPQQQAAEAAAKMSRERQLTAMRGAPIYGVPMQAVPEAFKQTREATEAPAKQYPTLAVKEDVSPQEEAARDAALKQLGKEVDTGKVATTGEVGKDQGEFVGPQKDLLNKIYGTGAAMPAGAPATAAAPQVPTGTSVAAPAVQQGQQTPAAPQGPVSRPEAPKPPRAEPVPAGEPGGTPVAPVGEGTPKPAAPVTKEEAKAQALSTVSQGLDAISNEFSRNAERAAATIDFGAAELAKSKDAMTDAEIMKLLLGKVKELEPPQPNQAPLNIPKKLSIQQLLGYARAANTTEQQQQVLDAFANNMVTGMYAPTLASRLSGDYKKAWLDATISQFPPRSTPVRMHPADAMYKMAAAVKAYQGGEKTEAEIAAGQPEAKAFATRAGGIKNMALAQQAAEKATEIRELLQARRIDLLSKANKAMDDFIKTKPQGKGGGAKAAPIDVKFWWQTNGAPIEEATKANREEIKRVEARVRELDGKAKAAQALASDTRFYPPKSQMAMTIAKAKAEAEGLMAERQAAKEALQELYTSQQQLDQKATELREFAAANIGKKQTTLVTTQEGAGKFQSKPLQKQEAGKPTSTTPTGTPAGQKTTTGPQTGKPTGGQTPRTQPSAKPSKPLKI